MKNLLYTILLGIPLLFFSSCEDMLKEVDFTVTTEKTSYQVGEEITFSLSGAPDWVTFYSGEENKEYPESYGVSIKTITNDLTAYTYSYNSPGTYNVVFLGGNTNYQGSKEQVITITITVN